MEAHGKHLLDRFEGGLAVHVHLGMRGLFLSYPDPAVPPHGGVRLRLAGTSAVDLIAPTTCEVLDDAGVARLFAKLGPDPLRPDADEDEAVRRLRVSRLPVAAAVVDQAIWSGVGNAWRAELLYLVSGCRPPCRRRGSARRRPGRCGGAPPSCSPWAATPGRSSATRRLPTSGGSTSARPAAAAEPRWSPTRWAGARPTGAARSSRAEGRRGSCSVPHVDHHPGRVAEPEHPERPAGRHAHERLVLPLVRRPEHDLPNHGRAGRPEVVGLLLLAGVEGVSDAADQHLQDGLAVHLDAVARALLPRLVDVLDPPARPAGLPGELEHDPVVARLRRRPRPDDRQRPAVGLGGVDPDVSRERRGRLVAFPRFERVDAARGGAGAGGGRG
ncbi:MAG: hypothetical protein M3P93_11285, partial [Actinomycetota bacterium]|nr:hypothetical protein [Actinomycetota bacterium]